MEGLYNPTGRGFLDIVAQSMDFMIIDHTSKLQQEELRSGATPMFASIEINLNSICLTEGKPELGFLNPLLYSLQGAGFNDIIHGCSGGCTGKSTASGLSAPHTPGAGWNATVGWDPVTGLGTPDFGALAELVRAL
ncbi:hypothetical protein PAAG_12548 [Paracoccidioides lutzii Pb01]|uniref:tripeptidyl-peptidase II n=1 Tax=Paracoccidioides lutzii (strain ATCC MYA-826 / Pb01) TaxID=502779 RepID=A0A0A2UZX0_PARBA|nr:hypothetical protein PAAG_12548 [Paracoccidioides lutzii Pb01]KGQ00788.1 hypothetical protein PAAG_12548 [Paracoccidioides lutzii Pb01]